MEQNLARANDTERASMARDTYSYLHLPIVAGIIFVALGLKKTVAEAGTPLDAIPAVALCGGAALYLLGDAACRLRDTGSVGTLRLAVAATVCGLVFFAIRVPAFVTLAVIVLLFAVLTALETAGLNPPTASPC